jgi:hypothetical protein
MTQQRLDQENIRYPGAGGVSQNCSCGFWPAFLDTQTRAVYPSRFTDGRLAPFHILDGLPDELVLSRNPGGRGAIVKASVVSGFIRDGFFYSRDQAAAHAATMLATESAFDDDENGSSLDAKPRRLERARGFRWRFPQRDSFGSDDGMRVDGKAGRHWAVRPQGRKEPTRKSSR